MPHKPLIPTAMQERYVRLFDGNHVEACRKAGYKNPISAAARNKSLPHLQQAIRARENNNHYRKKGIATRKERQAFWTSTMNDEKEAMSSRLRASELLGKSEADFTEKVEHSIGASEIDALIQVELQRLTIGNSAKSKQLPNVPAQLPEKTTTEQEERDEIIDLVENQVVFSVLGDGEEKNNPI